MSILAKAIYGFYAIPIKLPMVFFTELEQIISQCVWKHTKARIPKAILRKKNGTGGIQPACVQTLLQSHSHEDSMTKRHKDSNIDQWIKRESPEIKPHTYGHLSFDKESKNTWRKDNLFNKWCLENWSTTCKRMKLEHFITPHTK